MSLNQTLSTKDSTLNGVNRSSSQDSVSFNTSEIPEEPSRMSDACGYCDIHCIYHAIECIFTVGIIANAIVVFRVARDRKLRNTTFVSIAACAAADMCFLIAVLVLSFETVIFTVTCDYPSKFDHNAYRPMKAFTLLSANGHVTLLAIVRYVILTYPLRANVMLSTRKVLLFSALIWALSFLCIVTMAAVVFIVGIQKRLSYQFQLTLWVTVYLTPVATTVTLHLVKIYKIRQANIVTTNQQARRFKVMSRMVLVVIFIATVLPFPIVLDRFLCSLGLEVYGSSAISLHVKYIADLLILLNHSINPVMYAFLSSAFRLSLKRMLGLDRNVSNDCRNVRDTPRATLAEIQRRKDILKRMTD